MDNPFLILQALHIIIYEADIIKNLEKKNYENYLVNHCLMDDLLFVQEVSNEKLILSVYLYE